MELNPNHAVTGMTRDHWYKIVGILMHKFGRTSIEITEDDVASLGDNQNAIVADCRGGKFIVRLLPMEEAEKLAREEGGLPV